MKGPLIVSYGDWWKPGPLVFCAIHRAFIHEVKSIADPDPTLVMWHENPRKGYKHEVKLSELLTFWEQLETNHAGRLIAVATGQVNA